MQGYYVRLAKANNDEFINVKREKRNGLGWGEGVGASPHP